MLYAAGSVGGEQWLKSIGKIWSNSVRVLAWTVLVADAILIVFISMPTAPVNSPLWNFASKNNGDLREELGWPELTEAVAKIRDSLPEADRARVGILAGNYGEAGAINLYGPRYNLPEVISGVNSFWARGYGNPPPETLIVIGLSRDFLDHHFSACEIAGHTPNPYNIENEETSDHPDIYVCRGLRRVGLNSGRTTGISDNFPRPTRRHISTIEKMAMRRVYLDNNATTPMLPEVLEAMLPYFGEHFGNASSIHHHGQETRSAIEHARGSVAALLGARAAEIVFTAGGTEGDNLAVFGTAGPGDHVITSTIEHSAVLNACKHLAEKGSEVTFIPVDGRGLVDPSDIKRASRPNTKLISIMFANNETGVLQPAAEIGKIAAEADVYFHTDAVQAAGKVPINVDEIGCDLLTISGHKLHGPQGVGALFIRKKTQLEPMLYGGSHERSRRAGTENVPGIVGLGKASELATAGFERGDDRKMAAVRDRLESELLNIEAAGLNGENAETCPEYVEHIFRLHRRAKL